MSRKLSYRELEKKRQDGWILFYIQDPQDAETIFKNDMTDKDKAFIRQAYDFAKKLIEDFKKNPHRAVQMWCFYHKKEIRAALTGEHQAKRNELTLF